MKELLSTLAFAYINNREITILELSDSTIKFMCSFILNMDSYFIQLKLYNPDNNTYQEFIAKAIILQTKCEKIRNNYIVSIKEINYPTEYKKLLNVFELIMERKNKNHELQKLSSFDGISKLYIPYPYEKDIEHCNSYSNQIQEWFGKYSYSYDYIDCFNKLTKNIEFAFTINNYDDYSNILNEEVEKFCLKKYKLSILQNHPIVKKKITRIYIGNEYCPNLFPDLNRLEKILNKLAKEKYSITISYPFLQESRLKKVDELLDYIKHISSQNQSIEFVINDWGMLQYLIEKKVNVKLILGSLLNKRKKDPRTLYWSGYDKDKDNNKVNNLNSLGFVHYLNNFGIERYEFEDINQKILIPAGNHSLYTPYYQINTSTFCNLYANVNNMNANNVLNCKQYCRNIYSSYPKHLDMIGKGNSIFGFNRKSVLFDLDRLEYYVCNHINRIVLTI